MASATSLDPCLLGSPYRASDPGAVPDEGNSSCFPNDPDDALHHGGVGCNGFLRVFSKEEVGFQQDTIALFDEGLHSSNQVKGLPKSL